MLSFYFIYCRDTKEMEDETRLFVVRTSLTIIVWVCIVSETFWWDNWMFFPLKKDDGTIVSYHCFCHFYGISYELIEKLQETLVVFLSEYFYSINWTGILIRVGWFHIDFMSIERNSITYILSTIRSSSLIRYIL